VTAGLKPPLAPFDGQLREPTIGVARGAFER
jgi:hypothetical protein